MKPSRHPMALGLALGLGISLLLPAGQIAVLLILSRKWSFHRQAAFSGVWLTNPWTIPFIYPILIQTGRLLCAQPILSMDQVSHLFSANTSIWSVGGQLLFCFFIGSVFWAIVVFTLVYLVLSQISKEPTP